jgi:hypothetical protein
LRLKLQVATCSSVQQLIGMKENRRDFLTLRVLGIIASMLKSAPVPARLVDRRYVEIARKVIKNL